MALSAVFSVEGSTADQAHSVNYGTTVDLAITSLTGIEQIAWSIISTSFPDQTPPDITTAGAPAGATASFPQIADPGDGQGRAYVVKLQVSSQAEGTVTSYRVVGTPNSAGVIPGCPGEETARDATRGWSDIVNRAILATGALPLQGAELTGAAGSPGQTIDISGGAVRVLRNNLAQNSVLRINNGSAVDHETITIVSLNSAAFTYTIQDPDSITIFQIPASTRMAVTVKKNVSGFFDNPVAIRLAAPLT